MRAGLSRREAQFDAVVALAFVALAASLSVGLVDRAPLRLVAIGIGVVHCGALAFRRVRPVAVVAVMAATAILCPAVGLPVVVLGPAVIVAVYTVGARVEPRLARVVLAAVLVVTAGVVVASGADFETVVSNSGAMSVALWLGERSRRATDAAEAERAAAAETARRAVVDERLRIARELHDVVAHAISVIAVQAGTGRFVIRESPDVAAQALATIETTSRAALQDLRRLLTVLRDEDLADDALLPAPGVRDLDALVAESVRAGIHVDVSVRGDAVVLPAGVDLCVYRVVQEALTNVRKHARAQRATLTLTYSACAVTVEVVDDGVGGPTASPGGHGLVGMRERVELYGGSLDLTANGNGFRVTVRIPLGDA